MAAAAPRGTLGDVVRPPGAAGARPAPPSRGFRPPAAEMGPLGPGCRSVLLGAGSGCWPNGRRGRARRSRRSKPMSACALPQRARPSARPAVTLRGLEMTALFSPASPSFLQLKVLDFAFPFTSLRHFRTPGLREPPPPPPPPPVGHVPCPATHPNPRQRGSAGASFTRGKADAVGGAAREARGRSLCAVAAQKAPRSRGGPARACRLLAAWPVGTWCRPQTSKQGRLWLCWLS